MGQNSMDKYMYPLLARSCDGGIRFALESESDACAVLLFDRKTRKQIRRETFTEEDRIGNVYCKTVPDVRPDQVSYLFEVDGKAVSDPRAQAFEGKLPYGQAVQEPRRAVLPDHCFDWEGDARPAHPYEDSLWYQLHVRGFTKSASSGVSHRGTFLGITEKLEHLKSLGVTTLELQPVWEFEELSAPVSEKNPVTDPAARLDVPRLNYWGYKQGFYYAPKSAYASGEDASFEFRTMVKTLHRNGMEVICQFYFPGDYPEAEILEILRFWVIAYHVDGFHVMGEHIPMRLLAQDALLSHTKLLCDHLEGVPECEKLYHGERHPRRIALSQDDFQYPVRRLLKGDEGVVPETMVMLRSNPAGFARINYLCSYRGFTLADLVSYDRKHNEENGENGRDGSDFNFSWNCGEEGPTRKKKIKELRMRQMKNAMSLLFLGAGVPMLFMGDEFGNSQKGNNNAYCIDGPVTWLDWKDLDRNRELYEYVKALSDMRQERKILCRAEELTMMDRDSCGYPDISYHGDNAWRPRTEPYSRSFGVMYCEGTDGSGQREQVPSLLYAALNLHWNMQKLALPKPPKGYAWEMFLSSGGSGDPERKASGKVLTETPGGTDETMEKAAERTSDGLTDAPESRPQAQLVEEIPGRTVSFYRLRKTPEKAVKKYPGQVRRATAKPGNGKK